MAKEAGNRTNEAVGKEQEGMANVSGILGEYTNGNEGGSTTPPTVTSKPKIADLMQKPDEEQVSTQNQEVEDAYGNPVTIPAGFIIVPNGESNVSYTYSGDGVPAVQDGIVIEDANATNNEKNQFVWIPVCTEEKAADGTITIKRHIQNKTGDIQRQDVRLARYSFDSDLGTASIVQNALNYENQDQIFMGDDGECFYYAIETKTPVTDFGITAMNLQTFIENANKNGGYYIARYEAVKGTDEKVKSIPSSVDEQTKEYSDSSVTVGMVWSNITPLVASTKSKEMYDTNLNFETDIINSYTWDTTIVFIQTYSDQTNYSKKTSFKSDNPKKTGERLDGTLDRVCNIYDMASNLSELTTENIEVNPPGHPGQVVRGGCYAKFGSNSSEDTCGQRIWNDQVFGGDNYKCLQVSFRPILYFK